MSDGPAEDELAEELAATDEPQPEEYEPDADVHSDETGTAYDVTGEAETTPHDDEPEDES